MSPVEQSPKASKRILIVEDEDAMARVLQSKFEHNGFEAHRVNNGREALEHLTTDKEDVILMDILMPEADGFTVLHELPKTQNRSTPVFILSNIVDDSALDRAKELGARDCFLKARTSLRDLVERVQTEIA